MRHPERCFLLIGSLIAALFADPAYGQARIGAKMDIFELQSTDGSFYGTKNADGKVSILFFVGYN